MTTNTLRDYGRQLLISVITTGLVWAPLADQAYAASTPVPLADIPIAAKVTTKPNIVYTLDDSGSMQFGYLPDWVVAAATSGNVASITRVGTTATATLSAAVNAFKNQTMYLLIWGANQAQYDGTFLGTFDATGKIFTYTVAGAPATPATGAIAYSAGSAYCRSGVTTATCSSGAINTFNSPPYYAADFNALAYNPNVNYTPPIDCRSGACLPLTHTIGTDTDVNGNQINFAKVQPDPFVNPGAAYANLTATVAVPLYCNTDWPLTAGVNLAITDVGNANGEYSAGTGAWCRINGTPYDASAASGAPQVPGTYSYPYQASSGATGTQYFYRPLANKVLWCDSTSPLWPRNATITGCNGGTPVTGAPVQQTCNRNGFQCNPTVALRNYTPAACKTGPFPDFCAPNTGGSDGNSLGTGSPPECTACTCNADFQPAGGKCSVTAAVCNGPYGVLGGDPAECPSQPGPITGCTGGTPIYQKIGSPACNSVLFDPVANAPSTTTLLQDSNAQGYLCRHNNQSYAVSGLPLAGGPFTYSRTNAGDVYPVYAAAPYNQKGQFTSAVSGSCPTVGTTINIPRHY